MASLEKSITKSIELFALLYSALHSSSLPKLREIVTKDVTWNVTDMTRYTKNSCKQINLIPTIDFQRGIIKMLFTILAAFALFMMNCVASNTIALIEGQRAVQSNKIDTGTPSEYKSLSISGYYSMVIKEPDPFISKSKMSIKYKTDLITPDTLRTTKSMSTMFETPQSFGAEIRYDANETFSIGNIFDYSSNSERDDSLIFYDVRNDERGIFSFTFYLRFVANSDYILCGYRPEIGFTSVKGDYIVFADTSKYLSLTNYKDALEYDDFKEVDLFFRHAFFIRLFPQMPFSVFGGIQHALIPAHMRYYENSINNIKVDKEHVFAAYPGIGITINKRLYIDFYSTLPLYSSKFRNKSPISLGLKTQFRFF